MGSKKTITEILNLLPIVKNNKYSSPGVYTIETDTTFTGNTNKSDKSTDPYGGIDTGELIEGKIINNIK